MQFLWPNSEIVGSSRCRTNTAIQQSNRESETKSSV